MPKLPNSTPDDETAQVSDASAIDDDATPEDSVEATTPVVDDNSAEADSISATTPIV